MDLSGSWAVEYTDGTFLQQFAGEQETPFRAIDWTKVAKIQFDSIYVTQELGVPQLPPGYRMALMCRNFWNGQQDGGETVRVFMVVTFDESKPINPDIAQTYTDACVAVTYWVPNGVVHQCPHFFCKDVAEYCSGALHDVRGRTLALSHEVLQTTIDTNIE